jgi:N-acyl-D-amino-acid deacylase
MDNYRRHRDPEGVVIALYPPRREYEGRSMAELARELGCDPAEVAIRLYQEGEGSIITHAMKEEDVELIARHPLVSVGSDGSSLSAEGVLSTGKPHPRSYGTNPRFLARFVRERRLVSLEEGVRKMTSLPASRLGLTRRGRIAPGYWADLVIFDRDAVEDTATFKEPHQYPKGIPFVVVNGTLVVENGQFTGRMPGRVLRRWDD